MGEMMKVPSHLAFIPDGNRRCAKRLMKQPWKGHEWGVGRIRETLEWCREIGIRNVTVYALSLENFTKRPKRELNFLLKLADREIRDMISPEGLAHRNRIRFSFFGQTGLLPDYLQETIQEATSQTRNYADFRFNIAMAYGGRQELVDASRSIAIGISQGKLTPDQVSEMVLRQNLQTNGSGDPDLIIRTGGEKRLSNFLLFQAAYSELAFTDTFWPDITREEFMAIISDFSKRNRRFGGQ